MLGCDPGAGCSARDYTCACVPGDESVSPDLSSGFEMINWGLYSWQKIYFSFHHQDVVDLRADVVRHWLAKAAGEDAGFFDEMTWGDAILGGHAFIKRMLTSGLDDTSVTCVLIGSQTSARRWVRYEIVESIQRGNLLLGAHQPHSGQVATDQASRKKSLRAACPRHFCRRDFHQGSAIRAWRVAAVRG